MLNYLPAHEQLNIHRLWGDSINKDEQICGPCLIMTSCRHRQPSTVGLKKPGSYSAPPPASVLPSIAIFQQSLLKHVSTEDGKKNLEKK